MKPKPLAVDSIDLCLESARPIRQILDLVDEQQRRSSTGKAGGTLPLQFPPTWKSRLGGVGRQVERAIAPFLRQLEQQCRLANLSRSGEQLKATRGGLGQSATQLVPGGVVARKKRCFGHACIFRQNGMIIPLQYNTSLGKMQARE
jgi:hypothetical protein